MGLVLLIMHHSGFFGVCLSLSLVDKSVCSSYVSTILEDSS